MTRINSTLLREFFQDTLNLRYIVMIVMFDILYYSNHIDKYKSIEVLMNAIPKVIKETNHQIVKSFEKVEKVYEKVIKENQK